MRPSRTIDFHNQALRDKSWNESRPPDDSISWRLWQASSDLAQMALESDYVQGIAHGNLNPDDYCRYTIQDLAYSYNGLQDCAVAESRAIAAGEDLLAAFTRARYDRLTNTINSASSALHINDPTAVVPGEAARAYIDFEHDIASELAPVYYVVASIPCLQLWSWLSSELEVDNVPSNIYRAWIIDNNDWSGAYSLDNFVDTWFESNAAVYSWSTALEVYRGCMSGEVNFFRAACGQSMTLMPDFPGG